jgi:thiamine biosynthesis lipoprotein
MVDAGGDLAVSGLQRSGEPWTISIDDPRAPGETLGVLHLGCGGVATSGIDYRRWKQGDRWRHHIIDPRTGLPAETDVLTATVVAPNVMEAEMAAKVVLILGSRAGREWLAQRPNCTGLVVLQDGQVMGSPTLQSIVTAAAKRAAARHAPANVRV